MLICSVRQICLRDRLNIRWRGKKNNIIYCIGERKCCFWPFGPNVIYTVGFAARGVRIANNSRVLVFKRICFRHIKRGRFILTPVRRVGNSVVFSIYRGEVLYGPLAGKVALESLPRRENAGLLSSEIQPTGPFWGL